MKRDTSTDTQQDPATVEVGEIDSMDAVNWEVPNPFTLQNADPAYAYYHAADRKGTGGVEHLKSLGYEVDPTQKSAAEGHVLMRLPAEKKRARERAERRRQLLQQSDAISDKGRFENPVEVGHHDFGQQGVGARK